MKDNFEEFVASILNCMSALQVQGRKLTGNETEAEDLVQDTLYRALIHYESYVERGIMLYWLIHIMRNIHLNNVKRKGEIKLLRDSDTVNVLSLIEGEIVAQTDDAVLLHDVLKIIDTFSAEFKEPLLMFMAGYKYEEIACRMGIPEGTVKSRIHFARKRLRLLINK